MIGYLEGSVMRVGHNECLLLVAGVGYEVCVPTPVQCSLVAQKHCVLYVHAVYREDSLTLFGFETPRQKEWFKLLLSVQGLGPKLALSILSQLSEAQLLRAITSKDPGLFKGVKGVGPRLREKMIMDLGPKCEKWWALPLEGNGASSPSSCTIVQDALLALKGLGFQGDSLESNVRTLKEEGMSAGDLIKKTLAEIGASRIA